MTDELEALAKKIEALRGEVLFGEVDDSGLGPMSTQEFLLAIAALEMAQRHMALATYLLRRGD